MKKIIVLFLIVLVSTAFKCPDLKAPKLIASSTKLCVGNTLILAATPVEMTTVYWTGPDGTFIGNPLIRENITKSMAGTYTAKYVYLKKNKCESPTSTIDIEIEDFPQLLPPKISSNSNEIKSGSPLFLAVPPIDNTIVKWTGPNGTFQGNPWIIDLTNPTMTGVYTAQYIYTGLKGHESLIASKIITVYDPYIDTVIFNNKVYSAEIDDNGEETTLWFRAKKGVIDPKLDIEVLNFLTFPTTPQEAKKSICKLLDNIDHGRTLLGCLAAGGAAACAIGIPDGTELIPQCITLLRVAPEGLALCLQGIIYESASSIGLAKEAAITSTGLAISKGDIFESILAELQLACLKEEGMDIGVDAEGRVYGIEPQKGRQNQQSTNNQNSKKQETKQNAPTAQKTSSQIKPQQEQQHPFPQNHQQPQQQPQQQPPPQPQNPNQPLPQVNQNQIKQPFHQQLPPQQPIPPRGKIDSSK